MIIAVYIMKKAGRSIVNILAIESSCDETAAAVVRDGRFVLSNIIHSQIDIHKIYGGVVPEIASRSHIEKINQVVEAALTEAGLSLGDMDAVAVTKGPGLVGPLLVGVSAAKAIAFGAGLPIVGVHHIDGHISACYLEHGDLEPPFSALVASGGHAHLVRVNDYGCYEIIGRTRDDAPGEAFDKVARALGLPYPGGPSVEKCALSGDEDAISFPRGKVGDSAWDFSFSGLKSAVLNYLNGASMKGESVNIHDVAASFQKAVTDVLVEHSIRAVKEYQGDGGEHLGEAGECHGYDSGVTNAERPPTLILAGGVASNTYLRTAMERACEAEGIRFITPSPIFCTDNAAMIGAAGYYAYQSGVRDGWDMNAVPGLSL